jgi:GT2 family glycosyltransferase
MTDSRHRSAQEDLAALREEVEHLGRLVDEQDRTISGLRLELLLHSLAIGWRLQLRLERVRTAMLAVPGLRQIYRTIYRALEIWVDEGFAKIFVRTGHKLDLALRGRDFLVEDRDRVPRRIEDQYETWRRGNGRPWDRETIEASLARLPATPRVSVLAAPDGLEHAALRDLLATLQAQAYPHWELCLAVSPATRAALGAALDEAVAGEPRLLVAAAGDRPGLGDALGVATGELVGWLEAGDALAPEALLALVERLGRTPEADIAYSDEDAVTAEGRREAPRFKPDWSPDLLLSTNYLERVGLIRRALVDRAGGFRDESGLAQGYDLVLRASEIAGPIAHVARVLCHHRRRPVTIEAILARHAAGRDECRAIEQALERRGRPGRASLVFARSGPRCYATRVALRDRPLVSIVIPTRNHAAALRTTIESIRRRTAYERYEILVIDNASTDPETRQYLASLEPPCRVYAWNQPFNYSAVNNFGVGHAAGEQVLFLNNDVEVLEPDWLTVMLEHAQRPEVGAVGAKLLYPDGRIQHAGVVVGINRSAANAFRLAPGETIGAPRLADLTRNCSAVTGACLLVPRRVFEQVGGFDERLRLVLNDVDLCLRIRDRGHLVVYTPGAVLTHFEGTSRGLYHPTDDQALFERIWDGLLTAGDPYYNANLAPDRDDWSLRLDPG